MLPSARCRGEPLTAESDLLLATRLANTGDPVAFDLLYRKHTPVLYAIALRRTRSVPDAEDAVHDCWLRAVAALQRFRGAAQLRTWLVSILINRLREGERALARATIELPEDAAAGVVPPLPANTDPIDLRRALEQMPPRYHEVLILHDVEGFTHSEIGTMLGITAGTSKSQLARGRQWVRRRLDSTEEHGNG